MFDWFETYQLSGRVPPKVYNTSGNADFRKPHRRLLKIVEKRAHRKAGFLQHAGISGGSALVVWPHHDPVWVNLLMCSYH